jgi:hypothetical protein
VEDAVTEQELIRAWQVARWHIIVSQFAPTFLLTLSIAFLWSASYLPVPVRLAAAGILLASGILGAVAQISAAQEGLAVVEDLKALPAATAVGRRIARGALWMRVVQFVTPAIFVVIFVIELVALFAPAA